MPKGTKERDGSEFQKILTSENKAVIEKILDATEASASSGARSLDSLRSLIGDRPTFFLVNLMDANRTEWIKNIKSISDETKAYCYFLFGKYAYRLRGSLGNKILEIGDSWTNFRAIKMSYDFGSEDIVVKIVISKINNEIVVIEEYAGGLLELSANILSCVVDAYREASQKSLFVESLDDEFRQTKEKMEKAFAAIAAIKESTVKNQVAEDKKTGSSKQK